jgi:Glucose / Sorbosone dehydrogenase
VPRSSAAPSRMHSRCAHPSRPSVDLVIGRVRRALAGTMLVLALGGCATFPDDGPRDWREKVENAGELGGPPLVPESEAPEPPPEEEQETDPSAIPEPTGCVDPDPQVVATCLGPVSAVAVLPDSRTALVAERGTGRVLRVQRGVEPVLVTTVPVDASGGGGLTGLVLSPGYAEDRLVYAYATTPEDNRVLRLASGEEPKPVFTGIPRGARDNAGALATDGRNALVIATGSAGLAPDAASLAGKVLRIDTLGRPAEGNPDPASPIYSAGLTAPGGVCVGGGELWVTDRSNARDVLFRATPGQLGEPAWTWPERPGVGGCVAQPGLLLVAQAGGRAVFVLRPGEKGAFTGAPETLLQNRYGRLSATAAAPDGLLWLGTVNKGGGRTVASDDRVIRLQPPSGGGESRT